MSNNNNVLDYNAKTVESAQILHDSTLILQGYFDALKNNNCLTFPVDYGVIELDMEMSRIVEYMKLASIDVDPDVLEYITEEVYVSLEDGRTDPTDVAKPSSPRDPVINGDILPISDNLTGVNPETGEITEDVFSENINQRLKRNLLEECFPCKIDLEAAVDFDFEAIKLDLECYIQAITDFEGIPNQDDFKCSMGYMLQYVCIPDLAKLLAMTYARIIQILAPIKFPSFSLSIFINVIIEQLLKILFNLMTNITDEIFGFVRCLYESILSIMDKLPTKDALSKAIAKELCEGDLAGFYARRLGADVEYLEKVDRLKSEVERTEGITEEVKEAIDLREKTGDTLDPEYESLKEKYTKFSGIGEALNAKLDAVVNGKTSSVFAPDCLLENVSDTSFNQPDYELGGEFVRSLIGESYRNSNNKCKIDVGFSENELERLAREAESEKARELITTSPLYAKSKNKNSEKRNKYISKQTEVLAKTKTELDKFEDYLNKTEDKSTIKYSIEKDWLEERKENLKKEESSLTSFIKDPNREPPTSFEQKVSRYEAYANDFATVFEEKLKQPFQFIESYVNDLVIAIDKAIKDFQCLFGFINTPSCKSQREGLSIFTKLKAIYELIEIAKLIKAMISLKSREAMYREYCNIKNSASGSEFIDPGDQFSYNPSYPEITIPEDTVTNPFERTNPIGGGVFPGIITSPGRTPFDPIRTAVNTQLITNKITYLVNDDDGQPIGYYISEEPFLEKSFYDINNTTCLNEQFIKDNKLDSLIQTEIDSVRDFFDENKDKYVNPNDTNYPNFVNDIFRLPKGIEIKSIPSSKVSYNNIYLFNKDADSPTNLSKSEVLKAIDEIMRNKILEGQKIRKDSSDKVTGPTVYSSNPIDKVSSETLKNIGIAIYNKNNNSMTINRSLYEAKIQKESDDAKDNDRGDSTNTNRNNLLDISYSLKPTNVNIKINDKIINPDLEKIKNNESESATIKDAKEILENEITKNSTLSFINKINNELDI